MVIDMGIVDWGFRPKKEVVGPEEFDELGDRERRDNRLEAWGRFFKKAYECKLLR